VRSKTNRAVFRESIFLLLILSLCVRSIVPSGLMLVSNSESLLGFDVVACDGSEGFASVPGLLRNEASTAYHLGHHHTAGFVDTDGEETSCEECDFLWASSGFEEFLQFDDEIQIDFLSSHSLVPVLRAGDVDRLSLGYNSRAPPSL